MLDVHFALQASPMNNTEQRKWEVFLVDDHPMVREHVTALLQREQDLQVCGEAADAPTALSLITRQAPDLVILHISLEHSHGLELLKDLKNQRPDLPVLVLSMHDETLYAERALRAGAMGYITKEEATVSVLSAVRKVLAGQVYLSDRMSARMMQKMVKGATARAASPAELLADRELEVFQMIGPARSPRTCAWASRPWNPTKAASTKSSTWPTAMNCSSMLSKGVQGRGST